MAKLPELRKRIDEIDAGLLELLEERFKLACAVGEIKKRDGLPIHAPGRERDILTEMKSKTSLNPLFVESFFTSIIDYCRRNESIAGDGDRTGDASSKKDLQANAKIAILGPAGTFTEIAALEVFKEPEFLYCTNFEEVFAKTGSAADYGVVAIENSLEGAVSSTMDCLIDYPLSIIAEVTLDINLCLISPKGARMEDVEVIYSHPHGLAQCRGYIISKLPDADLQDSPSTAKAAQKVSKLKNAAAVGTKQAAKLYGLEVLAENIQDSASQTRFVVLASEGNGVGNKTSLIFGLSDRPGALYDILKYFADSGINLTRIESRPAKRKLGDYLFFIDFLNGTQEENVKKALDKIKAETTYFKLLGSY